MEDVAVVGVKNEKSGEVPRAFIVGSRHLTADSIHSHMMKHLAKHKQLAGGVVFINEIPKSASGKILRRQLVEK